MDIWEILEIDETTDTRAIKKAYAKMLTKYHPEDEPEMFQEIKQAYDLALKYANGEVNPSMPFDNPYFEGREFINFDYPIPSNNIDSIFANIEEFNRLDKEDLEKVDQLIADLKLIKEPDITAEKLERLVADVHYEMVINNIFFPNFIKELQKYLTTHASFLARRQHIFAIIKARFDNLYDEAQFYENVDDIYKICKWLNEFEVSLQERYLNIKEHDQQYRKSFTWAEGKDAGKTFDQQYQEYMEPFDREREQEAQKRQQEGNKKKTGLAIIVTLGVFWVMIANTLNSDRNNSIPAVPSHSLFPEPAINQHIDFASQGYSEEIELYIYQAVRSFLFDEYGKEFSTDGMMINPQIFVERAMATLIYFPIDDSEMTVFVTISYRIDDDSVEIISIRHIAVPSLHYIPSLLIGRLRLAWFLEKRRCVV